MGNRTRLPEMTAKWRTQAEAKAAQADTLRLVERWKDALAAGKGVWWPPTIRAEVVAGMLGMDVHCPGCQTSRGIDIRTIYSLFSGGSLVLGRWGHDTVVVRGNRGFE